MNSYEKIIKIMREQGTKNAGKNPFSLGIMKDKNVCEIKGMEFDFTEGELIIADHLMEREAEISFSGWETESTGGGSGETAFEAHKHDIKAEKKKITVNTSLKAGDIVLCAPVSDEQYAVIERMVEYVSL